MLHYHYADVLLASAWPLEELPRAAAPSASPIAPALTFDVALTPPRPLQAQDWLTHWREGRGEPLLSLARLESGYLLRFPLLANFTVDPSGQRVALWPEPGVNRETLRHLLLDQVLPRALAHQGRLVLHAAATLVGEWAVAWTGPTGAGKSTLAASFHLAGCPLLCDDGLVLNATVQGVTAQATYSSLRLWPSALDALFATAPATAAMAHYSSKRRLLPNALPLADPAQPHPLAAVFVLTPATDAPTVTATQVSSCKGCMALVANAFQLDVTDRRRVTGLLDAASACATGVPVFELTYPRDFAALPAVRAAILDAVCTIKPR